jgi:CheY-like chemotaxis protein
MLSFGTSCKSKSALLLLDTLLVSHEGYSDNNYYYHYGSSSNDSTSRISQKDGKNANYIEDKPLSSSPLARLLVVDDDPDMIYILKLALENSGFLVDAFTNPKEALQSFKHSSKDFSLVLSDFRMSGLSGFELAKGVKAINPDVKVIIITAFEIMDKESVLSVIDGLIQKPVSIKELANEVSKIIGRTKKRRSQEDDEELA